MIYRFLIAGAGLALGFLGTAQPAQAQEKYISEIIMVGTNFCPRGTMPANGQLLRYALIPAATD
ncbi:MAG: hypothetical protein AAGJ84_16095, partial [Pseudomonadota bacterium]